MSVAPTRLDVGVRPYASGDREAVRSLLRKTFGSPDVFDQFASGNPLGEVVAVVATHADSVIGFNMWSPWLVHGGRGPLVAYQSGASAVDESARGQGVFGKLLRTGEDLARSRGVGALFGFPNPSSLPGFLKAGWEHPCSLRLFVSMVPALGLGPLRAERTAPPSSRSAEARFVAWRYERVGVAPRAVTLPDGRCVMAYVRSGRRHGLAFNKLLDVVDDEGRRVTDGLGVSALRLPGPGATIARSTHTPRGAPPWLPVRRDWETPLILKRLRDDADETVEALRGATYWYGDIDAS